MRTLRPIPVLLCLLLGLAASVAVAWGLSVAYDRRALTGWRLRFEKHNTPGSVIEAFDSGLPLPEGYPRATWLRRSESLGRVVDRAMGCEGWVPGEVMQEERFETSQGAWSGERERFGWPMAALERRSWMSFTIHGRAPSPSRAPGAFASPLHALDAGLAPGADGRGLPLRPAWLGLGVNTLVFGGAGWCLLAGAGAARRWRRRRSGRCAACGYQTDELTICPECGV